MRVTLVILLILLSSCSYMPFEQRADLADTIEFITNVILGTRPQDRAQQPGYSFTIDGQDYYPDDSGYVILPVMEYDGK